MAETALERGQSFLDTQARAVASLARPARGSVWLPSPKSDRKPFVWGEPDNIFREASAPAFELTDVPAPIHAMADAFSGATGFDYSGAVVAATVAVASVIDDRYRLSVQPNSEWFESSRLWAVLIGTPSTGKSPTIRAATDPIKAMHGQSFAVWAKANEGRKPDEREPLPCLYTSDATVEALADVLRDNPRGVLMVTEEFASWIGGIDAYRDGAGSKNRGEWLQLYDGGPHQVNRVKRGAFLLPNWGATVLAACTPAGLRDALRKLPDDGLIQRFMPVLLRPATQPRAGSARQALAEWERRLRAAFEATTCATVKQGLRINTNARVVFDAEAKSIRENIDAFYDYSPALAGHIGKHPGMLARVAAAFHVIDGRQGDAIEGDTMQTAARFMRKVRRHAAALYMHVLESSHVMEVARALARAIAADGGKPASIGRNYMVQHCRAFRSADDFPRRLAVMASRMHVGYDRTRSRAPTADGAPPSGRLTRPSSTATPRKAPRIGSGGRLCASSWSEAGLVITPHFCYLCLARVSGKRWIPPFLLLLPARVRQRCQT